MSTKSELIQNLLGRLYQDNHDGVLKIKDNIENHCLFCDKKFKETILLKLKFQDKEHKFFVNFCKTHLKIFNDDVTYYHLPKG
ncbi:MAG: hypothetical protein ACTSR8_04065 [Promethearchaeota archaeon]